MTQNNQALQVALAAARQLPPKLQEELAERLISAARAEKKTVVVYLQRLSSHKQVRLTQLMDKNTEGQLSQAEQQELERLGAEVDQMLLANSQALARALRPELFDERGRTIPRRLRQALSESLLKRAAPKQEHVRG
ncbi:MAG: hypothetical protein ACRERD_19660 [Candidatus Binatia bacterium]